jgi:hypothetical protein
MSAHLRDLKVVCCEPGCGAAARQALYSAFNAHLGDYCGKHARLRLRHQLACERSPCCPVCGRATSCDCEARSA